MESCRGSYDDKSSVIYVDWERRLDLDLKLSGGDKN